MDVTNLIKFKEWALPKGFTEEHCNQYYNSGGEKRRAMFEKGDEKEIEVKFKRWVGIVTSYTSNTRKPKGTKEALTMYSSIEHYIKNATTLQLLDVIEKLEELIKTCKQNIENNKVSEIKTKESQLNVVLQQLKDMGVDYEVIKK